MSTILPKNEQGLRFGYTTGSCATAAAAAAAQMLLCGDEVSTVDFMTPKGIKLQLDIEHITREENRVRCGVKKDAGDKNVLLFLSGGVDSTVAFALLNKALGQKRVLGLHIDNGFMRKNESKNVEKAYREHGFENFVVKDASESFLNAIKGLTDPQKKRMAVGENFITVRDAFVKEQNLLYPFSYAL